VRLCNEIFPSGRKSTNRANTTRRVSSSPRCSPPPPPRPHIGQPTRRRFWSVVAAIGSVNPSGKRCRVDTQPRMKNLSELTRVGHPPCPSGNSSRNVLGWQRRAVRRDRARFLRVVAQVGSASGTSRHPNAISLLRRYGSVSVTGMPRAVRFLVQIRRRIEQLASARLVESMASGLGQSTHAPDAPRRRMRTPWISGLGSLYIYYFLLAPRPL